MIQEVEKEPKVALCRNCRGMGKVVVKRLLRKTTEVCPQCNCG